MPDINKQEITLSDYDIKRLKERYEKDYENVVTCNNNISRYRQKIEELRVKINRLVDLRNEHVKFIIKVIEENADMDFDANDYFKFFAALTLDIKELHKERDKFIHSVDLTKVELKLIEQWDAEKKAKNNEK